MTGGNRNVIESLRSKFKRCIAMPSGDDAALISYCNEEDSSKWPDSTNITSEQTIKIEWFIFQNTITNYREKPWHLENSYLNSK